ncbi:DUF4249 family protein [Ekhidna sp.]
MRYIILTSIWLLMIQACTEPFEVENKRDVMILDGRVSSNVGQSFVRIYKINADGSQTTFNDFDVRIVDTNEQETTFITQTSFSNTYLPEDFGFVGLEGIGYKVIATNSDGIMLESDFDYVVEPIDFDFEIGDTTVVVTSQANEPIFRDATTAIASVTNDGTPIYSKLDFNYRYMELFTEDTIIVQDNDYVLFSCDDNNECDDRVDVTAGFTTRFEWFFILRSRFCDRLASVTQLNFVENCTPAGSMGCCEYRDQWETVFKLELESLSKETFMFWEDLERLTTGNGLIFDTYPFPLEGNVTCQGCDGDFFGLLRASSTTVKEQIVIL